MNLQHRLQQGLAATAAAVVVVEMPVSSSWLDTPLAEAV